MNAQTKPTPGPWEVTAKMVNGANDAGITSYTGTWTIDPCACWEAMVKVSPAKKAFDDLLSLLQDAPCTCEHETGLGMMYVHEDDNVACYLNRARAAITKATRGAA